MSKRNESQKEQILASDSASALLISSFLPRPCDRPRDIVASALEFCTRRRNSVSCSYEAA